MTETIREPARDTAVLGRFDVAVAGGGPLPLRLQADGAVLGARSV